MAHGSLLGIWERIASSVREAGHYVLTPELPGNGRNATLASEVSLQTYVGAIGSLVPAQKEVVPVGHSMAGIIVSSVAEAMPKSIAHLVYLAAFMLPDGASVVSFQEAQGARQQQIPRRGDSFLSFSQDKSFSTLNPDLVLRRLCNTCTRSDAQLVVRHLAPQPTGPRRDPAHVTEAGWGSVSRTYIKTLQDNAVSTELQAAMIAQLPATPVVELDSDHSPSYSDSEKLVQILLNIA